MVEFKTIKYKHYRRAMELMAREEVDDAEAEEEHFCFLLGLVKEWDFVDGDTKELLPVGVQSLDELTIEQLNEMTEIFNTKFLSVAGVKKTSNGPSSSTLMPSRPDASPQPKPQSGYKPLYSPGESA